MAIQRVTNIKTLNENHQRKSPEKYMQTTLYIYCHKGM